MARKTDIFRTRYEEDNQGTARTKQDKTAIARQALAAQKKPKTVTDLHNTRNRKLVAEYALANNANKKKPPRRK